MAQNLLDAIMWSLGERKRLREERHVHVRFDPWADAPPWAIAIGVMLAQVLQQEWIMADTEKSLEEQIASNNNLLDSAIVLINGLADKIINAVPGPLPPALQSLVDEMRAKDLAFGQAIVAGTAALGSTPAPTIPAGSTAPGSVVAPPANTGSADAGSNTGVAGGAPGASPVAVSAQADPTEGSKQAGS